MGTKKWLKATKVGERYIALAGVGKRLLKSKLKLKIEETIKKLQGVIKMDLYVNQDVVIRTEDLKKAMMTLVQKVLDAEMQGKKVSEEAKEATKVLHTASLQDDWVMYRP